MRETHGQIYIDYCRRTGRFFPSRASSRGAVRHIRLALDRSIRPPRLGLGLRSPATLRPLCVRDLSGIFPAGLSRTGARHPRHADCRMRKHGADGNSGARVVQSPTRSTLREGRTPLAARSGAGQPQVWSSITSPSATRCSRPTSWPSIPRAPARARGEASARDPCGRAAQLLDGLSPSQGERMGPVGWTAGAFV